MTTAQPGLCSRPPRPAGQLLTWQRTRADPCGLSHRSARCLGGGRTPKGIVGVDERPRVSAARDWLKSRFWMTPTPVTGPALRFARRRVARLCSGSVGSTRPADVLPHREDPTVRDGVVPRRPLRKPASARAWCPRSWRSSSAGVSGPALSELARRAARDALGRRRNRLR
jgi:hypothetical protein